ncbi:MAG: DNA polymerase III subunit gamma/tau [Phycisphaerales bacterium]|nr:DNA polymerase III subunit gamma/tau [Phycisphaerales bacterium]
MSYTVLARKYRSQTFDDVIGQEPIATTLSNAIKTGRIHHGYLFTGTRGSGKTSMARILAKSLNCLSVDAPTVAPCLKCDACINIAEGQDLDVVEIDAASNTGVDNIRELRSNAAFRPARSRFKIYIIDEVHMLSTGAFNALLKTLEEPPEHVKFILATTEIQKVPATIQSRCQRFNFRNIAPDAIAGRLQHICKQEKVSADDAVIRRVARLANGSMRDALSVLDQLISVSPSKLSADVLDEILPPTQDEQVFRLLARAADGDVAGVLGIADALFAGGRGLENFCNDTIDILRTLMLLRACGAGTTTVDVPAAARGEYLTLAEKFELSQFVQLIAMFEELRRNVRFSGAGRALTDALLVRVARMRAWSPIEHMLAQLAGGALGETEKKKPPLIGSVPSADQPISPEMVIRHAPAALVLPADSLQAVPPPAAATRAATLETLSLPRRGVAAAIQSPRVESLQVASAGNPTSTSPAAIAGAAQVAWSPDGLDDEGEVLDSPPPEIAEAAAAPQQGVQHRNVTTSERDRVMRDPVVQQVLELFDGVVVNVERAAAARQPTATGSADEPES